MIGLLLNAATQIGLILGFIITTVELARTLSVGFGDVFSTLTLRLPSPYIFHVPSNHHRLDNPHQG